MAHVRRSLSILLRSGPGTGCMGSGYAALPSALHNQPALVRLFSSGIDAAAPPPVQDPGVQVAVDALLASNWHPIEERARGFAEAALAKKGAGREVLVNVFSAAQAVETFTDRLEELRMDLDDANGDGAFVGPLAAKYDAALTSILARYHKYLASFAADETWLRKKAELELGTELLRLRQRCAHLSADWGKLALLGTCGISTSYIERRASRVK